jgi:hypothetical protein
MYIHVLDRKTYEAAQQLHLKICPGSLLGDGQLATPLSPSSVASIFKPRNAYAVTVIANPRMQTDMLTDCVDLQANSHGSAWTSFSILQWLRAVTSNGSNSPGPCHLAWPSHILKDLESTRTLEGLQTPSPEMAEDGSSERPDHFVDVVC